MVNFEQR